MAFPDNRAEFIALLDTHRTDARDSSVYCRGSLDTCFTYWPLIADATTKNAVGNLYYAVEHLLGVANDFHAVQLDQDPKSALANFLDNFTTEGNGEPPPEYELTWKKIVIAWGDASDPGKMWTITMIDQLRRNIWNKNPKIKWDENPYE